MSKLQILFLLLVLSFFALKGILSILMYFLSKRLQEKGQEFQRKRNALKDKAV
jgi:hypothetical protein